MKCVLLNFQTKLFLPVSIYLSIYLFTYLSIYLSLIFISYSGAVKTLPGSVAVGNFSFHPKGDQQPIAAEDLLLSANSSLEFSYAAS